MDRAFIQRGFTLIELMVTISIAGLLMLMVAPSFQDMILMQRLRGVDAQLITDLQYARAEAVSRARYMIVNLGNDTTQTCYVIYYVTESSGADICDCTRGAGSACTTPGGLQIPGYQEIKTVSVPRSGGVELTWPADQHPTFAFDYVTGGLLSVASDSTLSTLPLLRIFARVDDTREITNQIIQTGRPRVCGRTDAAASRMQVPAC